MPSLISLVAGAPVLADGAWATQLQALRLQLGECPEAWNLTHADRVEAVARAYVQAGSRVLLTNTFGANRIALARHGLEGEVEAINRAGVVASCRAAEGRASVFASIGPTGAMLATGEISAEEVGAAFAQQAGALASAGAEGFIIETMSDLFEAELAVAAAHEIGLPVVACMAFGVGEEGGRTVMGVTPEQAAEALAAAGADALGANCGNGPASLLPVCERLRAATALPLWMKPNAGLPERVEGRPGEIVYQMTPEKFAAQALALVKAGATFIGGCCGTGPAFIRALAEALERELLISGETRLSVPCV